MASPFVKFLTEIHFDDKGGYFIGEPYINGGVIIEDCYSSIRPPIAVQAIVKVRTDKICSSLAEFNEGGSKIPYRNIGVFEHEIIKNS